MWMTPDPRLTAGDLLGLWRTASAIGLDTVVMMFHSSELMPGGSPFRPDAASVAGLLECLDTVFAALVVASAEFRALTPLATVMREEARLEVRAL